ncbi:hypothetical protein MPTK1_3g05760 [Marchantia polymorpha subsp. ruderalis]|uniref:Uncharacterized protein n=2 Tax=Marchantia polymorpha TaxID=3197 RepID=A0AAF6AXT4_MARPO|nr:hypothetical protein MARPO_0006s0047 [Marchantia polymorpha]BBN04568.1 hypothetical protein Mp_3g05760 [Marchantia polymorpha subsp. ruderalis]|eukprot:PTQ48005.1 hypothetical protein MARPO_0006s0047 [Marchantia polymorpha]
MPMCPCQRMPETYTIIPKQEISPARCSFAALLKEACSNLLTYKARQKPGEELRLPSALPASSSPSSSSYSSSAPRPNTPALPANSSCLPDLSLAPTGPPLPCAPHPGSLAFPSLATPKTKSILRQSSSKTTPTDRSKRVYTNSRAMTKKFAPRVAPHSRSGLVSNPDSDHRHSTDTHTSHEQRSRTSSSSSSRRGGGGGGRKKKKKRKEKGENKTKRSQGVKKKPSASWSSRTRTRKCPASKIGSAPRALESVASERASVVITVPLTTRQALKHSFVEFAPCLHVKTDHIKRHARRHPLHSSPRHAYRLPPASKLAHWQKLNFLTRNPTRCPGSGRLVPAVSPPTDGRVPFTARELLLLSAACRWSRIAESSPRACLRFRSARRIFKSMAPGLALNAVKRSSRRELCFLLSPGIMENMCVTYKAIE